MQKATMQKGRKQNAPQAAQISRANAQQVQAPAEGNVDNFNGPQHANDQQQGFNLELKLTEERLLSM